jgi:hypothetical protein
MDQNSSGKIRKNYFELLELHENTIENEIDVSLSFLNKNNTFLKK